MEPVTVSLGFGMGGGAFATSKFASGKFGGSDWVEMISECRASEPIVLEYGILSSDPTQLVADTGSLSFALNNGEWNSTQTLGFYSPLHAMKRGGFDFNIPVKLKLSSGGTTQTKFRGRLADILVTPGEHEDRMVRCVALDLMDDYARLPVPPIETQFGKRGDQLIQIILDNLPSEIHPTLTAIETGLGTYDVAMDQAKEESKTIRQEMDDICRSEMASIYIIGTPSDEGGLFAFRNRQNAAFHTVVFHHFENDIARGGLSVPGSRDDIISKVQVISHPVRRDSPFADVVLYSLETTSTLVAPGETISYIYGPYRDPDNPGDRVGGFDMVQPVAFTDYTMNNQPDGSGVDMTGNFIVTADYTGAGVHFNITNAGIAHAYVTKLQARGKGIYRYDAVVEQAVPNVPTGLSSMQIDMPYQNNTNVAASTASYLANSLSRIYARVNSVTFLASLNPTLMSTCLVLEPGDRIAITESVTGIEDAEFIINGVRLEIGGAAGGYQVWCTWYLKPADTNKYWFAGISGASEAGLTTVAGY